MTPKRVRLTALVALPLASFVAAGAFAAHAQGAHEAAPTPGSQRTPDSAPSVVLSEPADAPTWATSNFPRNAAGLTYGSDSDAKDEAGVPDLIAAMDDDYWQVRVKAARSLGRLKARAAVPALAEALTHPMSNLRKEAVIALGETGDTRAITPLEKALGDSDPDVRKLAKLALTTIQMTGGNGNAAGGAS